MQLRNLGLIAGAVISLTAMPLSALADITSVSQPRIAQAQPQKKAPDPAIKLSSEQEAQIQKITQQTNKEFENVLTKEQRPQFQAAIQKGVPPIQALGGIKLTAEQEKQLRDIFQKNQKRVTDVLTPQQRQQIQQIQAQRAEKIKKINQEANQKFEKVLTQEQRKQYEEAVKKGQNPQQAFAALKLSEDQKKQLNQIVQTHRQQVEALRNSQ
jgi:Spy/CpxP family protein refolding chaperone